MLKLTTIAALAALTTPAMAHDYAKDLHCTVAKPDGQRVYWTFAANSTSTTGSPIMTLVETGYVGGGRTVVSQAGARPIWILSKGPSGIDIVPRATPEWLLHEDQQGILTLSHRGSIVGAGRCSWNTQTQPTQPTTQNIPDVAPE